MRYQVPQFIEVEDKIFGPLTFKQFVYLVGGAGISFLLYRFLPFLAALPLIAVVLGFSGALAFYKVNNKPFIHVIQSGMKYFLGSKLYIWKKKEKKVEQEKQKESAATTAQFMPRVSDSKLKDISWSLGVKKSIYADTERPNVPGREEQNQNTE